MIKSRELLNAASKHIGEKYVLGAIVAMTNKNFKGPWDCAEFITYVTYQVTGVLYGFRKPEAYTGYWAEDVENKKVTKVSIEKTINTVGAILLRKPKQGLIGHIAFSDGKGGTIEARGKAYGVMKYTAGEIKNEKFYNTRHWDLGILLPNVEYSGREGLELPLAAVKNVENNEALVANVQESLSTNGFIGSNGFGSNDETRVAIFNFQLINDLEPSGILDEDTLKLLNVTPEKLVSVK